MTKHRFVIPKPGNPGETQELTSIVMSDEEFEEFIQLVSKGDPVTEIRTGGRVGHEHIEAFRKAKHVPLISRGTKTEYLFRHYGVETGLMSAIVRGQGEKVFGRAFGN